MPKAVALWKYCVSGGASNIYQSRLLRDVYSHPGERGRLPWYLRKNNITLLSVGSAKQTCVIVSPKGGVSMYVFEMDN